MVRKAGLAGIVQKAWSSISGSGTSRSWGLIREPFAGAWQAGKEYSKDEVLSYSPVFACITLIASDIAKLGLRAIGLLEGNVWAEITKKGLSGLLARPNRYQTRIQFIENWVISKLSTGNTYVFINRDAGGEPISLHILDPRLVTVLCSDDGSVFYELNADNVTGIKEPIRVPASEIIHDRFNCIFHPLQGVSPIFACSVAAGQGLAIVAQSTKFFENGSQMAGILSGPGSIGDDTAARLKAHWEENYTGSNSAGRVAVAGDGLKFEARSMAAADAQLVEQLGWTAQTVCSVFHVPLFMVGIGDPPAYGNVQSVNQQYYGQCLQILLESIELCIDNGLQLDDKTGVEFDTKQLLRMDSVSQMDVLTKATGAGILKLNEARRDIGESPMEGGDTAYLQQQNYSIQALAERDKRKDLWDKPVKATTPATIEHDPEEEPAAKPKPKPKTKGLEYLTALSLAAEFSAQRKDI